MTTDFILTVRPAPDGALDVAALERRGVAALAAPVMEAAYLDMTVPEAGTAGGLIFTSRHAIAAFLDGFDGGLPSGWSGMPVFVVGRATGRLARRAGFNDVTVGTGGGAGLVPLILARHDLSSLPLLWPCAMHRGFDMQAALAPQIEVKIHPVYEMVAIPRFNDTAIARLGDGRIAGVILMSARSARLFREMVSKHDLDAHIPHITLIAGSAAIAAAAGSGWREEFIAKRSTRARLLAIAALFYHRHAARY
jgi:uroporphyrinogen-III synthase